MRLLFVEKKEEYREGGDTSSLLWGSRPGREHQEGGEIDVAELENNT